MKERRSKNQNERRLGEFILGLECLFDKSMDCVMYS